uniref:Uncharacterized protein n=1 Tax=viral metagenome TaxID=1070528 RepID=A0A6H2A5D2_9ZZZZ
MGRRPTDAPMQSDLRRESSIPVQSRISAIELAKLATYWEEVEGIRMNSMSKLVSWSVSALCNLLESNNKVPEGIDSVVDAHRYLSSKGLYQDSLKARSMRKISSAMQVESLRVEGVNPMEYASTQHNMLNNKHSVEPFDGPNLNVSGVDRDMVEELKRRREFERQKKESEVSKTLRSNMPDNELKSYNEAREREVRERENAPIDPKEIMRLQAEKNAKAITKRLAEASAMSEPSLISDGPSLTSN